MPVFAPTLVAALYRQRVTETRVPAGPAPAINEYVAKGALTTALLSQRHHISAGVPMTAGNATVIVRRMFRPPT